MPKSLLLAFVALALACGDDLPDGADTGADDGFACLPSEVITVLERHALDLAATAGLLAGHPSQTELTGFLLAPALPFPPAVSAAFASLARPCAEARSYAPFCEQGRCAWIECTGHGAGWIHHLRLDRPVSTGLWYHKDVEVLVSWEEGDTGTAFTIATDARGPDGVDVSMLASGRMDEAGTSVVASFPALHPAGVTTFELADDASGLHGHLAIGELVVAELDVAARLAPTGDCP
jgi:hypothetical protein